MATIPPSQIDKNLFDPSHEGRTFRLLSQRAYNYVRAYQLKYRFEHQHEAFEGILKKKEHPILEHDVLIGTHDEAVALYSQHPIGSGAYGRVYFGVSLDTGQFLAIKKLHPLKDIDDFVCNLRYEKQALCYFGRFIDELPSFNSGVAYYFVQDLALDQNYLDCLIKRDHQGYHKIKSVSIVQQLKMAKAALQEVETFLKNGYIHRDLKLNNMMWDPIAHQCTLIDFATARRLNSKGEYKGGLVGTEFYMAPELYKNLDEKITYRTESEIYALGVCLCEIFSKHCFSFSGRALTIDYLHHPERKTISPLLLESFPDVLTSKSKLPSSLRHLICKMVSPNPDKRPSLNKAIVVLEKAIKKVQKKLNGTTSLTQQSTTTGFTESEGSASTDVLFQFSRQKNIAAQTRINSKRHLNLESSQRLKSPTETQRLKRSPIQAAPD